ncbi:hypothetical protein E2C01_099916 [Portunus trituberculatus]|uniref:Uncharacterized protein n=1 Tax=Portunus trituberculatus TaxID=210409 RepID=A0A5B7KGK9_PORTR|nr:hypothetical protein [Portunus trituberculatus]
MSRCWRARTEASSSPRRGHRRLPVRLQCLLTDRFIASLKADWSAADNAYPKQNSSGATGRPTYHKRAPNIY